MIVVVGAAIVAWWLWPTQKRGEDAASTKQGLIKEVKPQISTNGQAAAGALPLAMKRDHSELTVKELMTKVPTWAYSVEDRSRIDPGYARRHEKFLERQAKKIWKTPVDSMLAMLLFSNGRLGPMPPFNEKFKDMFLKSIQTPIIVSQNDPEDVREKKRQMIETKIWLKDQLDDGKDIVAILNDEYNHQKKITNLQDNLRRELIQLQKTAKSVQEVDDYIAAANKMLEEAGSTRKIIFPTLATKVRLEREAAQKESK